MWYSSLLRFAVLTAIAAGLFILFPGQANFDLGTAAARADDGGGDGRQCPGGR